MNNNHKSHKFKNTEITIKLENKLLLKTVHCQECAMCGIIYFDYYENYIYKNIWYDKYSLKNCEEIIMEEALK